ncbi:MAG: zinc ribbon domain-containing protein [Planctomycetota bacterium]|jgi:predicted  nucleic acid-binding Zn-ribbon protein
MSLTENLVNLFQIDAQVRGLRRRLDSAERYLAVQTRNVEELEVQRREVETRQLQIQARIGNLEGEMATIDERLEKLRNELNAATTNKQYTTVLSELNTAKNARSEIEDQVLAEMERVDENTQQRQALEQEIDERQKVRALAEDQLQQRHDEVGERLAELEAEREVAAAAVPGKERRLFDELADAYDGESMSSIEEIDRRHREYACGTCRMHIPFQAGSALLSSSDTLVTCTACGRIMYLQDEVRGALLKR